MHIRNPNKDPGFLDQVPTVAQTLSLKVGSQYRGLVLAKSKLLAKWTANLDEEGLGFIRRGL